MTAVVEPRPRLEAVARLPVAGRAARLLIVAGQVDVARRLGDGLVASGCAVSARLRVNVEEARALLAREAFTVVVVDLDLPEGEAFDLIAALRDHGTRVVALFDEGGARLIEAIAAGARGAIARQDTLAAARAVIEAVIAGQHDFTPAAAALMVEWIRRDHGAAPVSRGASGTDVALTARERDILRLAAAGHNYRRIAERLSCQPSTVYTHVRHIYEKLRVTCLPEALFQARERGLLD